MHCGQCGAALEHTGYWDACGMVPFCDAVCLDGWRGDGTPQPYTNCECQEELDHELFVCSCGCHQGIWEGGE